MTRAIEQLLAEYQSCLSWEPEKRKSWLEGLEPKEGANLFSMIHNAKREGAAAEEIYSVVEALNWIDYTQKMEKVARRMGIQIPT